jgi:hypothetical protein
VFVLAGLVVVGLFLLHRLVLGYPRPERRHLVLRASEVAFLNAAAATFFPAGGAMPLDGEQADLPGYADSYLQSLPVRQRRSVRLLFLLFEHATIVFPAQGVGAFRRFSSLTEEQRTSVLRSWSESRLYLRRLAFIALKAVLIMGYFGHPSNLRDLGLQPFTFDTPICEADLLYPPIGEPRSSIRHTQADVTPPSDGTPLRDAGVPS